MAVNGGTDDAHNKIPYQQPLDRMVIHHQVSAIKRLTDYESK